MTTATKPRFIVRDEELATGAPDVRCSGCEQMFAESETVIVRSPKVRSDAPCNFNSDDAMCFPCAGLEPCLRCGMPAERYFCSRECEDAERFEVVA